jgi:hypothetical protein
MQFQMFHPLALPISQSMFSPTSLTPFIFAPTNGDIILELGSSGQISCIVSSEVLKRESRVFQAMLGTNFQEGLQFEAARSKEVMYRLRLRDDNADAMLIMLACLHEALPVLDKELSVEKMIQIMVVVEKYLVSIKPRSLMEMGLGQSWGIMRRTYNGSDFSEQTCLDYLFLAWAFHDGELFSEISRELILNIDENSLGHHEYLPESVIGT